MPRRNRCLRNSKDEQEPEVIPVPVDIIDLTQDSPMNTALRLSRARAGHNAQDELQRADSISIITDEANLAPKTKKPKLNGPTVINLDETISLDDSSNIASKRNDSSRKSLTCPVCFECLADENIKAMTTPCGHVFCLECLQKVTSEKKKCSICQRAITFSRCIRLHI